MVDNWLSIHVLNVGQGDCILIQFPQGGKKQKLLIVVDHFGTNIEQTRTYIEQYLSFHPKEPILFVVSHAHQDHIKKMIDLLEYFQPMELLISPLVRVFTLEYFKLLNTAFKYQIPVITLQKGMTFQSKVLKDIDPNVFIEVISPENVEKKYMNTDEFTGQQHYISDDLKNLYKDNLNKLIKEIPKTEDIEEQSNFLDKIETLNTTFPKFRPIPSNSFENIEAILSETIKRIESINTAEGGFINNSSIVLKMDYHGSTVLLTGDIEKDGWTTVKKSFPTGTTVDILKIPHHGSNQGEEIESLIQTIQQTDPSRPKFSFISVDLSNNSYGHPNKSTIEKLLSTAKIEEKEGFYRLYRTDDFKHNGNYNQLPKLRNFSTGEKNEIISYIFGLIPPKTAETRPIINVYRVYHRDPSRPDFSNYAFEGSNKPVSF